MSLMTGGQNVPGNVEIGDKTVIFTPVANLLYDADYTVVIAGSVEDSAGNSMGGEYRWSFHTAWALFWEEAYIKAANAEANDNLGWSVAISGDTMVVGAPFEDSTQTAVSN